ncbi:hypothetical protein AX15_007645 [Amanita polypyramis BW_CC]|nr:hypothetical protein AX15_007645 [Amanita polypyramis BW_CC]
MAGHFQSVLEPSDLTGFVPFAIFVCSASMLIFIVLLAFSFFLKERNPISTRTELACLGLTGIFWLILGVFLVASDSKTAEVECLSSTTSNVLLADNLATFHTDQYQAMYRVLMTFSLMNATLILLAALTLLGLAIRRHRNGDSHMWHGPVTSCAWFNSYNKNGKPQRSKSNGSSILPIVADNETAPVRQKTSGRKRDTSTQRQARDQYPEKPLARISRQAQAYTTEDFNNGTLLNPGWLGRGSR